jgi:hypothetical protein
MTLEEFKELDNDQQEKVEALTKHLDISIEDITYDSGNSFSINQRSEKQGNTPSYYIDSIKEFKKLLTTEDKGLIDWYLINEDRIKAFIARGITGVGNNGIEIFTTFFYGLIEPNIPREPVIKDWLYNVNILYWLIKGNEDKTHEKLKKAWLNLPIDDDREVNEVDDGEYLVLTDDEAQELAEEYAKDLFNESVTIPDNLQMYIDIDSWIEDVINNDGRGSLLAGYDGEENEVEKNGTTYYIYRNN